MSRAVIVSEYDGNWPRLFEEEAARISRVFHPLPIQLHHIGSTSVEGLSAKPVIDILGEVEDLEQADAKNHDLEKKGYTAKGENGIRGRRYFVKKNGEDHLVHLHIFNRESDHVLRHLAFRDFLKTHPDIADFYGNIKLELAAAYPDDIDSYIEGKNAAVKKIEMEALNWWYAES